MATTLTVRAAEQGTYFVDASFRDENGDPVVPNQATWTLSDPAGNVVNERSQVPIEPAVSITILLTDSDLAIEGSNVRVLLIEWTYNSALGNDLPMKAEANFIVDDLVAIA